MMLKFNIEKITDALLALYTFPGNKDVFEHILSVLEPRVSCVLCGYSFTELDTGWLKRGVYGGELAAQVDDAPGIDEITQSHPFREIYCAFSQGPVLSTGDPGLKKKWFDSALYTKVYRPLGLKHEMSVRFYTDTTCVSFFFAGKKAVDEIGRRFLLTIAPHLKRAYILHRDQLPAIIDPSVYILTLSRSRRVLNASPGARELMDKFVEPQQNKAQFDLPAEIHTWIDLNLQKPKSGIYAKKVLNKLRMVNSASSLYLTFINNSRGWYILLEDVPWVDSKSAIGDLGLTNREAEVLFWIMAGKQNSSIAIILDVHVSTVRKHVEHILEKLGVENRGSAASKARHAVSARQANLLATECLSCVETSCESCPRC
jgi:DNA-binding CsgD family transcriptional regulator